MCSAWNSLYLRGFDLKVCWTLQPNGPSSTRAISLQPQGTQHVPKLIIWWPQPQQRECSGGIAFPWASCGYGGTLLSYLSKPGAALTPGERGTACCSSSTHSTASAASLLWQGQHSKSLWQPMTLFKFRRRLGVLSEGPSNGSTAGRPCRVGWKPPAPGVCIRGPRVGADPVGSSGLTPTAALHLCSYSVFATTVLWPC